MSMCLKFLVSFSHKLHIAMPYYAVGRGRVTGVYATWTECETQVKGFPQAKYKKFQSGEDAEEFVKKYNSMTSSRKPTTSASTTGKSTIQVPPSASATHYSPPTSHKPTMPNPYERHVAHMENSMNDLYEQVRQMHTMTSRLMDGFADFKKENAEFKANLKRPADNGENENGQADPVKRLRTSGLGESTDEVAVIYTDGACHDNGQSGARAGIGVYWGPDHHMNISERLSGRQTNNRAEIHAAIMGIRQAKKIAYKSIVVNTDSMFLINSITKWLPGWKAKDWKLSTGKEVVNKEDFIELEDAMIDIEVKWIHVKGHAGIKGNEEADSLANAGAAKQLP